MKAVVTGSEGQDAKYLIPLLEEEGYEVIKIPKVSVHGDVCFLPNVEKWIKTKPEFVFHLAASSSTDHRAAIQNCEAIGDGTFNILESALRHSPETKIFIAGSALQFVNNGHPIKETDPMSFESHYACVRNYSTMLCRYYRTNGLKIWNGFFFGHDSPYRKPEYVSQKIAIAAAGASVIEIGDLSVEKEWTFAGDSVSAIWKLVNQDVVFEANICTGKSHSVAEWADACFSFRDLDYRNYVKEPIEFEPQYKRMVGDSTRIRSTGWEPTASLREVASVMVINQVPK